VYYFWLSIQPMVLREFHLDIPDKGRIDVSFNIHFDSSAPRVGEIKIHADFDCNIPHRVYLVQVDDQWQLFDEHSSMVGNEIKIDPEYLNDPISNAVLERILQIRSKEMI
jgi:hypothetical protein